jgi:hypothetical protein
VIIRVGRSQESQSRQEGVERCGRDVSRRWTLERGARRARVKRPAFLDAFPARGLCAPINRFGLAFNLKHPNFCENPCQISQASWPAHLASWLYVLFWTSGVRLEQYSPLTSSLTA